MTGSMRTFVTDWRTDRRAWIHRTRVRVQQTIFVTFIVYLFWSEKLRNARHVTRPHPTLSKTKVRLLTHIFWQSLDICHNPYHNKNQTSAISQHWLTIEKKDDVHVHCLLKCRAEQRCIEVGTRKEISQLTNERKSSNQNGDHSPLINHF